MSWLSQLVWQDGRLADAQELAARGVAVLEELEPGHQLVTAHCQVALLLIAAEDPQAAMRIATRALELAETIHDSRAVLEARRTVAWIEFSQGQPKGLEKLEQCVECAEDAGLEADVAITHVIIARTAARRHLYDLAERHVRAGLEYCDGRDFDVWRYYLIGWEARLHLARGRWDDAAQRAAICLNEPCPFARGHALIALGLVRARRGDPDPWTPLDEALELARPRNELQWIAASAIARAEAAWLEGRNDAAIAATDAAFEFSVSRDSSFTANLACWRWRAGLEVEVPPARDDPYALSVAGEWAAAAARWREVGSPYEAALALADADDEAAMRRSLGELQRLGARPAAAIVARRLRERGVRGLPRGPRAATRENPAGLTARELEVLALLAEHLTNAVIAERLVVSEKTVDHHVSAVLRKLDVHSRTDAGAAAQRLGLAAAK